jgi:glutathione synthase/RimK-type ligase-like ATP-grasp enzyme
MALRQPILVYYEHPDWFRPLFHELERRGIWYKKIDAGRHHYDPAADGILQAASLFFNRMSPSAWNRGRGGAIFHTLHFLGHLKALGVPCFNGYAAFNYETSKSLQISLLDRLGIPAPRTRVVGDLAIASEAANELEFPIVVKPNIGGSGAGIVRFETAGDLSAALEAGTVKPGIDGLLLLQEYHPPRGRSIVRIETLLGRFLYAIRVHMGDNAGFDLCPADICKTADGSSLSSEACPVGAAKAGLTVESFEPPVSLVRAAERIAVEAGIDVGGIEYLESERDGGTYFYDVNALSNFVADPVRVVGFDPTAKLVDALEARAGENRLTRAATPVAEGGSHAARHPFAGRPS